MSKEANTLSIFQPVIEFSLHDHLAEGVEDYTDVEEVFDIIFN